MARFAESHGFEQDYDRPYAYHFRDFVIQALNQDMPYDQFVRWQLAGDEIAPDDPQALMATGFLGAGVFPTQITANEVERTRYDALDDMAAHDGQRDAWVCPWVAPAVTITNSIRFRRPIIIGSCRPSRRQSAVTSMWT